MTSWISYIYNSCRVSYFRMDSIDLCNKQGGAKGPMVLRQWKLTKTRYGKGDLEDMTCHL